MNICHFISSKGLGRGEFYIDLVNELSKNSELNITLLIPVEAKFLNRICSNISVIEYKSKDSRNNPFLYLELFQIFKTNNFSIVHTHFAKATEIFYRLNKIFKLIHIGTKHNPRKGKIFNKLKYVTAVSEDVKKSIKNNNTRIIYNGLVPKIITKTFIPNEKFTIRAIGRLEKVKGFDKLIENFSKIDKNIILEIVGEGNELEELNFLVKKYNVQDKINFLGFRKDIPELIASSDLIVISSISEGFSLVALETLYYGKLLISTKVGICKQILTDKLLINDYEVSDKIVDIINNYKSYTDEYLKVKEEYHDKFLLSSTTKNYLDYYERILKIENSNNQI